MQVVVCLKQVPDAANVRINPETNTLMREGVESVLNPFDEYALEQALALKDRLGARVTAVSMGPPQAKAVLRDALARGADTLATSYTLAKAIRAACGGGTPDLVLFGKQAIDGDTAQVGPGVSEFFDVALVTYVRELAVGPDATFRAVTVMDDGEHAVEGELPAVMTVVKEAAAPRFASLAGALAARRKEISVLDEKAIGADPARIGLNGSPTKVVRIFPPPAKGGGEKAVWNGDAAALARIVKEAVHG